LGEIIQTENYIDTYFWETDESLATNMDTIDYYFEYHMLAETEILMADGTYAEIKYVYDNKFATPRADPIEFEICGRRD